MAKKKENPVKLEIEIVRVKDWNPAPLLRMMQIVEDIKRVRASKSQKPA